MREPQAAPLALNPSQRPREAPPGGGHGACWIPAGSQPASPCRLREILEIAEDMEIDIPHIWLYLAELITPILQEEGIPMEELFR